MVTASSTSAKVPVLLAALSSGNVTEALSAATLGATSVALTVNEVVVIESSAFLAVMVTVYGLDSSGDVPVQLQVPVVLLAARSTRNLYAEVFASTLGATSVALTVNEVVVIESSAFLAVMVTVYGLD